MTSAGNIPTSGDSSFLLFCTFLVWNKYTKVKSMNNEDKVYFIHSVAFPSGTSDKEPTWGFTGAFVVNAEETRDANLIPGSGISPRVGMATSSSIIAWKIPWAENTGRLQSTGSQRVRPNWATEHTPTHTYSFYSLLFYLLFSLEQKLLILIYSFLSSFSLSWFMFYVLRTHGQPQDDEEILPYFLLVL